MRIYGVTGWKNQGKTTLMEALVRELSGRGLTVSTVKHAHHNVDIDQPGRDSFRHREAGAGEVVLSSANRIAFMHELRGAPEWTLADILGQMRPADIVLIEGYKAAPHPKLEIYRAEAAGQRAPIAMENPSIRAIVGDLGAHDTALPVFPADDLPAIADFVLADAPEAPR